MAVRKTSYAKLKRKPFSRIACRLERLYREQLERGGTHVNKETGFVEMSQDTMAQSLGTTRSNVAKGTRQLRDAGCLFTKKLSRYRVYNKEDRIKQNHTLSYRLDREKFLSVIGKIRAVDKKRKKVRTISCTKPKVSYKKISLLEEIVKFFKNSLGIQEYNLTKKRVRAFWVILYAKFGGVVGRFMDFLRRIARNKWLRARDWWWLTRFEVIDKIMAGVYDWGAFDDEEIVLEPPEDELEHMFFEFLGEKIYKSHFQNIKIVDGCFIFHSKYRKQKADEAVLSCLDEELAEEMLKRIRFVFSFSWMDFQSFKNYFKWKALGSKDTPIIDNRIPISKIKKLQKKLRDQRVMPDTPLGCAVVDAFGEPVYKAWFENREIVDGRYVIKNKFEADYFAWNFDTILQHIYSSLGV